MMRIRKKEMRFIDEFYDAKLSFFCHESHSALTWLTQAIEQAHHRRRLNDESDQMQRAVTVSIVQWIDLVNANNRQFQSTASDKYRPNLVLRHTCIAAESGYRGNALNTSRSIVRSG